MSEADLDAGDLPLTERILRSLPGARASWIVVVATLGAAASYVAPAFGYYWFLWPWESLAFAAANLLALVGIARLAARITALRPLVAELAGPAARPFRGVGSVAGPVAVAAIVAVIYPLVDFVRDPRMVSAMMIPVRVVGLLPITTGLWLYLAILWGLDELGRAPLAFRPFHSDRSLGLGAFGALAFQAFLLFVLTSVPLLLVALDDARDTVVLLTMFGAGVALFFLSMYRLHEQLEGARGVALQWVRAHYYNAGLALRRGGTDDALDRLALDLLGADVLERHALDIQRWPFNEAILRTFVAIATTVAVVILVSLLTRSLGL